MTFVLRWSGGDFPVTRIESPGILLFHSLRVALFVWSALEAFLYYAMLRKRIPLGLADPVVAGQIGLWGVAGSVMAGLSAFIIVCIFVVQRHPLEMAGWTALMSFAAIVVSVAMWCAFFPPQRLRAWLSAPVDAEGTA